MIKEKFLNCPRFLLRTVDNNRFSLCPDSYFAQGRFRNSTVPGRNSYFAPECGNSYFVRDNPRIVPIPTLRRTYTHSGNAEMNFGIAERLEACLSVCLWFGFEKICFPRNILKPFRPWLNYLFYQFILKKICSIA